MENTHMPFMAYDEKGAAREFCCRKIEGVWKLHHKVNDEWRQLTTGLQEDAVECAPTAEHENGQWTISFIAGGAESDRTFRLYKLVGETLSIVENADVGFVWEPRVVFGSRIGPITIRDGLRERKLEIPQAEFLYRVSYIPDDPEQFLISGQLKSGGIFSWLYRLSTGELYSVVADGHIAYKCAFFQGKCFYARKIGDDFEDREVIEAADVRFQELDSGLVIMTESAREMGCVDCLRKHIAAALSYGKEILNGHGSGGTPDHRPDFAGEIANAEHHAELIDRKPAEALRDYRHRLDKQNWQPVPEDLDLLRNLWLNTFDTPCNCRR